MISRLQRRYRRLTERVLWIACCTSCLVCFIFVFLSLYYLEDHRDRRACQEATENDVGSYKTLFKSYPAEVAREESGTIQDLIAENIKLRGILERLKDLGSAPDGSKISSSLQEQGLKYTQDIIKTESNALQRTVNELDNLKLSERSAGLFRSWQERSLKYIKGESVRLDHKQDTIGVSPVLQQTSGFLRDNVLRCREISQIYITDELGRGYTKLTHRGVYNGTDVAVKSVGLESTDLQNCIQEKRAKSSRDCLMFSRYKVMKELLLYQQLNHPNVVTLLGYCFQNDQDTSDIETRGLTVVTELGTPLNLMTVLQMAWHQRFRIAVGLARLLKYFSISPLGSLVIRDFQLIQFVIVNGDVKLSDLDDIGNEGHVCRSRDECVIGNQTYNITLPCVDNLCQDYNERWNLYNLERFYLKMFLLPGAPEHVVEDLRTILGTAGLLKYNSKNLVRDLERVLGKLRNGQGLNTGKYRPHYQYKAIPRADFPGCHDYECDHSISLVNCQSLTFNEIEAMRQCDEDELCKAFVMSYDRTWIGYKWVYFKNSSTSMMFSGKNMVYIKVR